MRHFYLFAYSLFSFAGDGWQTIRMLWQCGNDLGRLTPFGRTFDIYIQTGFDPEFSLSEW